METILKVIPQAGFITATMLLVAMVLIVIYKIIDKMPNRKNDEMNNFYRELTASLAAHNERASANHEATLKAFVQHQSVVQKNHEKFLENQNATLQILVVQNEAIAGFKTVSEKIVNTLDKIHDKCLEHNLSRER